jgi:hypothetical protein
MTSGDALLSYLNWRRIGVWSTFRDAVVRLEGSTSNAYLLARALCARGLVEFDWQGDRSWSAPRTTIIRLPRGPGDLSRALVVGLLDGSQRKWLLDHGLDVETTECPLVRAMTYSRCVVHGSLDAVLERLAPDEEPPFYIDFIERSDAIAERIVEAHPTIDQALRASPVVDPREILNAERIESYDPAAMSFAEIADVDLSLDYDCLMAQWRYDRRRYFSVRFGTIRSVDREMAICASVRSRQPRFFEVKGDTASVRTGMSLPVLLERALFFAGARLAVEGRVRQYSGVPNALLRQISYRLGISPNMESIS